MLINYDKLSLPLNNQNDKKVQKNTETQIYSCYVRESILSKQTKKN